MSSKSASTSRGDVIQLLEDQRRVLYEHLMQCNLQEDQTAADSLRGVIDKITATIELLSNDSISPRSLHSYRIQIHCPGSLCCRPLVLTVNLRRNSDARPLPLGHFFELVPPMGESISTRPINRRNELFDYKYSFWLGAPTRDLVKKVKKADFLVRLWHLYSGIRIRNEFVSLATVPLGQFRHLESFTAPLYFMTIEGVKTEFVFELTLSISHPLKRSPDLTVDEIVCICPEVFRTFW
jgi:hypothetical protein